MVNTFIDERKWKSSGFMYSLHNCIEVVNIDDLGRWFHGPFKFQEETRACQKI